MNAPLSAPLAALLTRLLSQPTAPFHEGRVMGVIREALDAHDIPHRHDRYGNLIARYRKGSGQPWALLAHTDHPGVEVTRVRGATAWGVYLGGVRPESLPGARVRLFAASEGKIGTETETEIGTEPDVATDGVVATIRSTHLLRGEKRVELDLPTPRAVRPGAFGGFDLPAPDVGAETIAAGAVDDLIGCATTLAVLANLRESNAKADVFGVFTRAEEVGFIGAQRLAESGALPRNALLVSLEASMEIPGGRCGLGPVVRVGDRTAIYRSDAEYRLHAAARALARVDPEFRFQRQLMTGGTCEATVFTALGYPAVGLAYPLRNYHNMVHNVAHNPAHGMAEGTGIDREQIHTADFLGGVRLLTHAVTTPARGNPSLTRYYAQLTRDTGRYRKRLG